MAAFASREARHQGSLPPSHASHGSRTSHPPFFLHVAVDDLIPKTNRDDPPDDRVRRRRSQQPRM